MLDNPQKQSYEVEQALGIELQVRRELAEQLHDGPLQWLSNLAMEAAILQKFIDQDPHRAKEEVAAFESNVRRTIAEMRNILFALRPLPLENGGLVQALYAYARRLDQLGGLAVQVEVQHPCTGLTKNAESTLFLIVSEALNNVKRHAQAQHTWITLTLEGNILTLSVKDDGKGFDVGETERDYSERGSLGLLNMGERAAYLGGSLAITSAPAQGTTVCVRIPYDKNQAQVAGL